jgi:DNA-binding NarL/FixJ family response regulator
MRVLIADDRSSVVSAMRLLLEQDTDLTFAGDEPDADGLRKALDHSAPHILLLDWELPGWRGATDLDLTYHCRPTLRVVAMSSRPEAREEALTAGAHAFLYKGDPPERVLAVLREVLGPASQRQSTLDAPACPIED